MLQTSPYWLAQYGNVAAAALASAAAANPTLSTQATTPFDIYYRQAAAALQQKHPNSIVTSSAGDSLPTQSLPPAGSAPLYLPTAPAAPPGVGRLNSLYLSSLPPTATMFGPGGPASQHEQGLLMPLPNTHQIASNKEKDNILEGGNKSTSGKSPSPSITPDIPNSSQTVSPTTITSNAPTNNLLATICSKNS